MLKRENIVYEDNHLLIVNKPAGLLVQGDKSGDITLAEQAKLYVKEKYDKPGDVFLGVVHRLDRPVSGAVILARTSKALERMNKLFKERRIDKIYWAITTHRPPNTAGELVHWLKKNTKINKTTAFNKEVSGSQKAVLSYKLIGRIGEHYLLEIKLMTGRPHQIRAQLAKMGCPILGDVKYGYNQPNKSGDIYLHSRSVSFEHPVKKQKMSFTAPVPNDQIWRLFKS
ncbi:RNA pseudouridylate synthase, group 1 [Fulvivirga imtechensis AK7]|uniref:RNA pseudouridylate synthase, group 1 n=1 Tax=Fulvivirga imtechensis AK7 TaxID=1237149 RepID=L8JRY4_9BACT|nr:RluA family pseudouridine synthase [Fulvivirga imtechensis]ELR70968.1 RNA pseudouridylate synthase, group 1 [Fulvivirga imtechensis AK7]